MRTSRALWPIAGAIAVAMAFAGAQPASLVARACGLALGLASLVVLTGWTGQLNLHVAAIGLGWGAYTAAGLAAHHVPPLAALLITPFVVAPAALLVGMIAVRFRGLELAIATLAAGLVFEQTAFQSLGKWLGRAGEQGSAFQSSLLSMARPGGFTGDRAYAMLAIAVAAVWLTLAARAGRGKPGRTLRVVRDREVVAEARGVPTFWWRTGAFVLSISIASVGGALLAGQTGAVTPGAFGFTLSLQLLAIATMCGIRDLRGALVGAIILVASQEAGGVRGLALLAGERADLIFGAGLIFVLTRRARRKDRFAGAEVNGDDAVVIDLVPPAPQTFAATTLRVENVGVAFGPAKVLEGVDLRVGEGEVVGLVGGNGAGKTTLFNCITGLVRPDTGTIFFRGHDITEMSPHRRARLGLARTFQGVEVFEGLTVREGLLVAADMRGSASDDELDARVRDALAETGISYLADVAPETLPFAMLRLVEIASALVADPALVLLDEPLAGLDARERKRILAAIERLRSQGRSVLLVEHDRESVAQVADRIYELRGGRATQTATRAPVVAQERSPKRKGARRAARV